VRRGKVKKEKELKGCTECGQAFEGFGSKCPGCRSWASLAEDAEGWVFPEERNGKR